METDKGLNSQWALLKYQVKTLTEWLLLKVQTLRPAQAAK